jgi:two-component system, sensor histidine kinase ChiS
MAVKDILLVEDEKMTARLIDYRLKAQGYNVTHIEDGIEALEHIRHQTPDILILDVMLPGMSGFEILETLKEENGVDLDHLKVIMLTTKSRAEDISRGFKLGAVEYLSKPFKMDELLLRLNRLIAN